MRWPLLLEGFRQLTGSLLPNRCERSLGVFESDRNRYRLRGDSADRALINTAQRAFTLVAGGQVMVSTLKPELSAQVAGAAKRPNETLLSGNVEGTLGRLSFLNNLFPLMVHQKEARRSLARDLGGVSSVVTLPTDLGWIVDLQAVGFVCGFFLLVIGVVWSQVIYGPIHRQARSIEAHLARLRVQRESRLTTKGFNPPFDAIAELPPPLRPRHESGSVRHAYAESFRAAGAAAAARKLRRECVRAGEHAVAVSVPRGRSGHRASVAISRKGEACPGSCRCRAHLGEDSGRFDRPRDREPQGD